MQVGFPQKSTFDTVTANRVNTPIINAVSADLQLQRAGAIGILVDTAKVRFDKHARLNTDVELQDVSGGALIASDNAGCIDELGQTGTGLKFPDNANRSMMVAGSVHLGGGTVNLSGYVESVISEHLRFGLCGFYQLYSNTMRIKAITIKFSSIAVNDYITEVELMSHTSAMGDVVLDRYSNDEGNGSVDDEEFTWTLAAPQDFSGMLTLDIETIIGTTAVRIKHIKLLMTNAA